ncbi:hypothetical protein [Nocardia sp. NPDC004260]
MADLGSFLKVTHYDDRSDSSAGQTGSAAIRRDALAAIADAYGLDKTAIAQQARYIRAVGAAEGERAEMAEWFVAATDALDEPSLSDDLNAVLTSDQLLLLLSRLDSGPDWISWASANVLANVSNPPWNSEDIFEKGMSNRPRNRAILLYLVAIVTAAEKGQELLARAAAAESADYRIAARIAAQAEGMDPDSSITDALRRDPDLSVRPPETRHDTASATHWSCASCRTTNDLDAEDCASCASGSRPDK